MFKVLEINIYSQKVKHSTMKEYRRKCVLQEIWVYLEYQILTDFIITNTDRPFNNFGVLRDANTLK